MVSSESEAAVKVPATHEQMDGGMVAAVTHIHRGTHVAWRHTRGMEAHTWDGGTHMGWRHTRGMEVHTWDGGTHMGWRHTHGMEADTWDGGTHVGWRHTLGMEAHI